MERKKKKPLEFERRLCKNPHCSNWFQPNGANHWYCRSPVCDDQRRVRESKKIYSRVHEYQNVTGVYKKPKRTWQKCQWEYGDGSRCGERVAPGNRFLCPNHFRQAGSEE